MKSKNFIFYKFDKDIKENETKRKEFWLVP